jgi:hypothetical protein
VGVQAPAVARWRGKVGNGGTAERETAMEAAILEALAREAARIPPPRLHPAIRAGRVPRADLPWLPERLAPLHRAAWFQALPGEVRLYHNQLYALLVTELFIWAEGAFAIAPIRRLLRRPGLPAPLIALLAAFAADEEAHTACFWDLLQAARPDLYPTPRFALLRLPARARLLAAAMARWPEGLASWILVINFLEEHTLVLSRAYAEVPERADPLFAEVYRLHALDEARHCRLDGLIAEWLLPRLSPGAERWNGRLLALLFPAYQAGAVHGPLLDRLTARFPELVPRQGELARATADHLGTAHLRRLLSREVTPITHRHQERFPFFHAALAGLAGEGAGAPGPSASSSAASPSVASSSVASSSVASSSALAPGLAPPPLDPPGT